MTNIAKENSYNDYKDKAPLRKGIVAIVVAEIIVAAAIFLVVLMGVKSHAGDQFEQSVAVTAYSDAGFMERFGDPFGDVFMEEHPLNDAWMGMSVQTIDGKNAGYISDAILDVDGTVDLVIVTPSAESELREAIVVGSEYVILGEVAVTVDMTMNTLASQLNAEKFLETAQLD